MVCVFYNYGAKVAIYLAVRDKVFLKKFKNEAFNYIK